MKRCIKWISITVVLSFVSTWLILYFLPLPPLLTGISSSKAFFDDHQKLLRLTLSKDAKFRLFTPLAKIPKELIAATLLQEDQYYYQHPGVNPFSLVKASWQTYVLHSRRMGASTITMQVARIRYGIRSKTWLGKMHQMVKALQLEMHYSKQQILEAYLYLAPYGNNVEGIGAASLIYFGKQTQELNLPEILTLAVIPQNPSKRIPNHHQLKVSRYALYKRWLSLHPEDKNKNSLMELPLQIRNLHAVPFLAPHFVNQLLAQSPLDERQTIITTLDLRLQKIIESVTKHYVTRKENLSVTNAAVIVVDSRNMGVKAQLGSVDFYNKDISGQVNGTDIRRSPGSTLKPFIYALAIDQGFIHPNTLLKDVPHHFGSYNPENFDNDFVGPIKAKDALNLSRNIPAIYLADQLKHPSLYAFLQEAGMHSLKPESYYGLALVLGGAEMSMQELVGLYAILANDGKWQPLRFTQNEPLLNGKQMLSREASFLVLDMLKNSTGIDRFDLPNGNLPVAFKTGTSSRYRDAWTIGIVGPYVIGVWIGNFNNQSNHAFIGKEIAAPLFFEIINAMRTQYGSLTPLAKYPERMHLTKVDVCKVSGMLPTHYCKETESVWFIPGKSPIKTDSVHREVAIDSETNLRSCHFNKNTRFEIFEFWPSDLLKIFKRAGIERRIPPPYDPHCQIDTKIGIGFAPQITSPQTEIKYVTRMTIEKNTTIPLSAVVDADVSHLYWFINESFIGKTQRNKSFLWHATSGKYVVRVVDDYGRSDARNVKVEFEN